MAPTPLIRRGEKRQAFSLVEVMVTLALCALMCVAAFGALQMVTRISYQTAARTEAGRVLQAEVERLNSVDYSGFVASSTQTIQGSLNSTFAEGSQPRFTYFSAASPVRFSRTVIEVASSAASRTLRVEVSWELQGRPSRLSATILRAP